MKLGALISTGKDSLFAMYKASKENEIKCLITIQSEEKDSYMFHTPSIELAKYQAEALELPLIMKKTKGIKEEELMDLKQAIKEAKEKYKIQGITTGALFSEYQKSRIDKICEELNLKAVSPLWHMSQYEEVKQIIGAGFEFIFTKIAAEGLDKTWLGVKINKEHLEKLKKINEKNSFNIAGEGGEFESLVLDMPLFKKKIVIKESKIKEIDEHSAELIINEAILISK
ncbi:TIGR00289 family protein [Candidatus Woesearchaeota archaeon ex4484_78]|nr:MAG: TIGR00289 family protein [Candidatus Woesearchaeota archaeon ex4484_78]